MGKFLGIMLALLALLTFGGIVGGIVNAIAWENTHNTVTCTVDSTDRTMKPKGGSDVRIYTQECGVLTIADDMFQGRFNSTDVYASIKNGKNYTFDTIGWRNGFFSQFPNIINVRAN